MKPFNIYMTGVGGQGIGLLSEILLRAADYGGHCVKAVDTHGLAQRGGIVVSQLRIGPTVQTPLISHHTADLVVALERQEAMRALTSHARLGATLIYYNTVWQPLDVRLDKMPEISAAQVKESCQSHQVRLIKVYEPNLKDVRMQNVVLLAHMDKLDLVPDVKTKHYRQAMEDLMAGDMLKRNLTLFEFHNTSH